MFETNAPYVYVNCKLWSNSSEVINEHFMWMCNISDRYKFRSLLCLRSLLLWIVFFRDILLRSVRWFQSDLKSNHTLSQYGSAIIMLYDKSVQKNKHMSPSALKMIFYLINLNYHFWLKCSIYCNKMKLFASASQSTLKYFNQGFWNVHWHALTAHKIISWFLKT